MVAGIIRRRGSQPQSLAKRLGVDVVSQGDAVDDALVNREAAFGVHFEGKNFQDSLTSPHITAVTSRVGPAPPKVSVHEIPAPSNWPYGIGQLRYGRRRSHRVDVRRRSST